MATPAPAPDDAPAPLATTPRTLLFVPADDPRKCERASASEAHAVVFDLEDAVAPTAKQLARAALASMLAAGRGPGPLAIVRVNAPGTPDGERDLEALADLPREALDALMVPKAEPASLERASALGIPLVALVETAAGVLRAEEIARATGVALLMLGPVDLAAELGCERSPTGEELLLARSQLVLASAAAGIAAPIDGPCTDVADPGVLRAEALHARRLGFGGKACIHPRQLDEVHRIFSPTPEQVAWAERVTAAYEAALAQGAGVAAVDGEMVDAPVAKRAQAILNRSGAGR
jgi:citrate lyase subunit beta/citryl-CoA lyase